LQDWQPYNETSGKLEDGNKRGF